MPVGGDSTPLGLRLGWVLPLAAMVVLVGATVVVDYLLDRGVVTRSDQLRHEAMRSLELVGNLRQEATELAQPNLPPERVHALRQRLEADVRAYEPLATAEREKEWGRLRQALVRLEAQAEEGDTRAADQTPEISEAVDNLVAINRRDAERLSYEMGALQRARMKSDLATGLVSVGLVGLLAMALTRARQRERASQAERLRWVERRNEELNAFAGQVAHDLRTPLQPIRGYAELILLAADAAPDAKRQAASIKAATERVMRVVDDMLELARSGRPVTGHASVSGVCREVLDELAPSLQGARCELVAPPCSVTLAPGLLAQVLRNLLTNAAKYRSPERPLKVKVEAERAPGEVVLSVEDNGAGMDEAAAAQAFQPFFRAHQGPPGHGLGLAIVESVVRGAGGRCELWSRAGEGTRVTLHLPGA